MSELFSRRSFLKLSGALVAASALAACSGGGGSGNSNNGTSDSGNGSGTGDSGNSSVGGANEYSDDINGLQIRISSGYGANGNNLALTIRFKNTTSTDITVSKDDFKQVRFDGNANSVLGFNRNRVSSFVVAPSTDSNPATIAAVCFDISNFDDSQKHTFYFEFHHEGKKAECSLTFTPSTTPFGNSGSISASVKVV